MHDGILYDNLHYSSDELVALYLAIGPQLVEVYGTPLDAGTIVIKHKATGKVAVAKSKQTAVHGVSRRIWRQVAAKLHLGRATANDHEAGLTLAQLIKETTEMATGKKTRTNKKAGAVAQSLSLAEKAARSADQAPREACEPASVPPQRTPKKTAPRPTTLTSFDPKAI